MVSNAQTGPCLRHLLDSIHGLKRQRRLQLTLIAALWSLLPAVVILFAAAGLDVLCRFGHPARYIACGVVVIAVIAAIVFVIRAALAKLSDQAMATLLEKARPEADNAFINAVQFAASEDTPPEIVWIPPAEETCIACGSRKLPFPDGTCPHCDMPRRNHCLPEYDLPQHSAPADALYCPLCGAETLFRAYLST